MEILINLFNGRINKFGVVLEPRSMGGVLYLASLVTDGETVRRIARKNLQE